MTTFIGARHSSGAIRVMSATGVARSHEGFSSVGKESVDSWTPGPKPLCHRHPTGPHPSGFLRTPWTLRSGERRDLRQECALAGDRRKAGVGGPRVEAAGGVLGVVGLVEIMREEVEQA